MIEKPNQGKGGVVKRCFDSYGCLASAVIFCSSISSQGIAQWPLVLPFLRKPYKRDKDNDVKELADGSAPIEAASKRLVSGHKKREDEMPSNYWLFPLNGEFRTEDCRNAFRNHKLMPAFFVDNLEEATENWVSIAKDIYKNGIIKFRLLRRS